MAPNDQFRKPSRTILNSLAVNIRAYRISNGVSQEEFAAECGLHRTYVGAIERGERNVTLSTLEAIAEAMKVKPYQLLMENPPCGVG